MTVGVRIRAALAALMLLLPLAAGADAVAETLRARTAALPMVPEQASLIDMRLGSHPDKTRFVVEMSERVSYRVTTAADPVRVVVELTGLRWSGGTVPPHGVVRRVRSETADGVLRLSLDTTGPVHVASSFIIPARDGRQPRLVIDLKPGWGTDGPPGKSVPASASAKGEGAPDKPADPPKAEFQAAALPAIPSEIPTKPTTAPSAQVVPAALPSAAPRPPAVRPAPVVEKPLVVLDPGHGGVDPGAIGVGGVYEKDITLAAAREVRRQLLATGRYRVLLTRDKDVFVRLRERVSIARDAGGDLFVSLHADSIGNGTIRGLSIYTLSDKASDREAEMLAAKENRADAIAGLDLSSENDLVAGILIDLAQRDTLNHSRRFARMALENLGKEVKLLPSKPHRQAGLAVLTGPDIPAVLIEMGYLSSPQDVSLLTSGDHRERMARGVTRAVDAYFRWLHRERKS
ncbi:N-acetylmuramoyl-L-alanine amidase [Azospirillum fermentarium]|uniref:N-acetylmuramoyl-L-alanine amidase family protein n=1 Tax=Azospirillum fermentarium TaxID=1233114 RepID=UPI0022271C93|nr:N-acetylmuramoyl-L-alanine amidase [Azospirillum fermentarium]MCW2247684.1 N-acetylmuramoyl-L-alanine amidase [Azospirillum fermentarium]